MLQRAICLLLFLAGAVLGAPEENVTVSGSNSLIELTATLHKDNEDVQELLGHKVEKGIIVMELTITPKSEKPYEIWHDDFIVRSDKDGQKSDPYDPGQIASNTVLTLVYTHDGGGMHQQENGPVWGGTGTEPSRLPGSGGGFGNAGTVESASRSKITSDPEEKSNPLLSTLRERLLKEEEITGPVKGLLYFPLEGKHKTKQIWLHFTGEGGAIEMQFKKK